jgi:uncharacterized protein YdeI (YjbR/CyaY-like superfamily)
MSPRLEPHDVIYFETPTALRDWFDANHATATELWIGHHKKATGRPTLSWSETVDEALCVGWIDGIRVGVDEDRWAQRFTPRRPRSTWSAINVAKVAALTAEGRMRPTGLAAFEARTEENTAVYSYEVPPGELTDAEVAQFRQDRAAWADWERRSPSYRRTTTQWVTSAKRPETRARRLAQVIAASAEAGLPKPLRVGRDA